MSGFSFQYFCNCVAILHESFWGFVWVFFNLFYQSEIARPDVSLCWGWLQPQWQWERTEVRMKVHHRHIWLMPPTVSMRWDLCPRADGCYSVCTGWAPDTGETLESLCKVVREETKSKLDWPQPLGVDPRSWGFSTWKKPPRSAVKAVHLCSCSVEIWACRRSNGLCESGAYWFFSRQLSLLLLCFPSFWELGKLVTQSWTVDGSWAAAWKENGWRERWRSKKGWVKTVKEIQSLVRDKLA